MLAVQFSLPVAWLVAALTAPEIPPPPPASVDEFLRRRDVDAILTRYWPHLGPTDADDASVIAASGADGATYGECTYGGARSIFRALGIAKGDVFADLGSGLGKLAAQCALECPVRRTVGVELSAARHASAVATWRTVRVGEDVGDNLDLVHGDLFAVDLDDVTHAYVSNLCFDSEADSRLVRRLAELPSLRAVATLKPLPESVLCLQSQAVAAMSWNRWPGCPIYIYRLLEPAARVEDGAAVVST